MSEQSVNKQSHPYPSNANGDPEFASVLVTLDPKFISRGDHHVVQKMVYSTQMPEETVLSLFKYYGEAEFAQRPDIVEILGNGFLKPAVYVYTTRLGVMEICLGTGVLRTIIERIGRGSALLGIAGLIEQIVSPMLEQTKAARGGEIPPLFMAQLSEEAIR
jgi:hypothetical protein